jgi:hypothetical protein
MRERERGIRFKPNPKFVVDVARGLKAGVEVERIRLDGERLVLVNKRAERFILPTSMIMFG